MAKDAPARKTTCPECDGAGYVEASAKDEGRPDDLGQNRFFSGGYIRVMRLR